MVDVMDVNTQKGIEMSMAQWRRYYETPPSQREKLYNVISLEFSHTKLENLVKRPASVDVIDWVDNMWPRHLKERQRDSTNAIIEMQYPKVQKYCLMSVQGCYTDFHIDFGGTSVWYHILRGGKVFWLIPPTAQNLELYENWVLSGKQGDIFLGDKASDCQRIELKQGYTFMIPSGWIHAVYTPVDTLVFGGNFLHSFNIPMQLHIYSIEDRTRVPTKFRYPFYYEMCWYVLERYLYSLTKTSYLTPEFQRLSLGIGLKPDPSSSTEAKPINGHALKEEDDSPIASPVGPDGRIHLTPFEMEGLWNLLGKLESLPSHKKCVPAGIHNAPALLHDIKVLLQEHANDDPKLAYSGVPIVQWPKRPSWYQPCPPPPLPVGRPRLYPSCPAPSRPPRPASVSALRRRRVRCKRCAACLRQECGVCNFCRDMKKFGGPGRLKQTCVLRQCLAPGLPLSAVCEVCGEGSQDPSETPVFSLTLMECTACGQIAHPDCIKVSGEGVVNKDLPSCWECPKCTLAKDTQTESSVSDEGDEDSVASAGSLSPAAPPSEKRSLREGVGGGGGGEGDEGGGYRSSKHAGKPPLPLSALPLSRRQPSSSLSQRPRRIAPPPSHRLLLQQQQQQQRRRAGALGFNLRKRIKMERDKILNSKRKASSSFSSDSRAKLFRQQRRGDGETDAASPDDEDDECEFPGAEVEDGPQTRAGCSSTSSSSRLRSSSRLSPALAASDTRHRGTGRRGTWGRPPKLGRPSSLVSRRNSGRGGLKREGERQEESQRGARFRRRQQCKARRTDDGLSEGERDRLGGVSSHGKENRPHKSSRDPSDDEDREEEEMEGVEEDDEGEDGEAHSDSEPDPPVLLVSDLSDDPLLNGSYLTVTLQRPTRSKRDPGSIVPKLEAVSPKTGTQLNQGYIQRKSLHRPKSRAGLMASENPDPYSERRSSSSRASRNFSSNSPLAQPSLSTPRHSELGVSEARVVVCRLDGGRERGDSRPDCVAGSSHPSFNHHGHQQTSSQLSHTLSAALAGSSIGGSASSSPPPTLSSASSFLIAQDGGSEPGCEKEVWVSVFRYLTRAELCVCMTVCKSWYKWTCDKRLWTRIDLSRCRSVSPQALSGIIKRQPIILDLSWTSISKKQLTWLINRLPGLKDLMLSGCSWSSVSALSTPSCPLLRTLDLRWAEGVRDTQIRDLIIPPGCDNHSKLRNMVSFRLSGLEVSDATLRLIIRHMPLLSRLDLSHCRLITDQSVNLLTAVGSSTRNTLTEINLGGCNKLTDDCLVFLKRVSCLSLLDLRGCKGISRRACEAFISELSVNALYCLSEDKLIQRIS
ncbi:lysine-specific demethylase 2A isoform X2 [Lepisosteus oculatus]